MAPPPVAPRQTDGFPPSESSLLPLLLAASLQSTWFVDPAATGPGSGTDTVSFHPRLAEFPQGTVAVSGDTWIFQYWFRDANPRITSNTSDAVSVMLR